MRPAYDVVAGRGRCGMLLGAPLANLEPVENARISTARLLTTQVYALRKSTPGLGPSVKRLQAPPFETASGNLEAEETVRHSCA